jgi:spermidine/putrescine-binding protein
MGDLYLPRRAFLQRAALLGLGATALGPLLEACGGDAGGSRGGPAEDPSADLGPIEDALNVYIWSDYLAPTTVPDFEREFGVQVTVDTYESNEELLAKLMSGASGYDLVVPSGYLLPALIRQGLLAPLHHRHLPNLGNLARGLFEPAADPGRRHAVPWLWGMTGLAWRTDKLPAPPESWSVFFDPRWRGKLTMMDDGREVLGAMLKYRGRSLNSTVAAELERAETDALAAKPNLKAYLSAPVKSQLIAGDVWVAQLWNGDTMQARTEQPALAFALPKEGSLLWADYVVVPASAPHKRAAHAFIDYVLRPPVGAALARATGYGTPNAAALALIPDPVPYPTAEQLARLEYQEDLGAAAALWDRIWTEVKSG